MTAILKAKGKPAYAGEKVKVTQLGHLAPFIHAKTFPAVVPTYFAAFSARNWSDAGWPLSWDFNV
jgi:hypothetical protein